MMIRSCTEKKIRDNHQTKSEVSIKIKGEKEKEKKKHSGVN